METFRRLEDVSSRFRQCVVSIGKFDGLHRGHEAIFARVVELSREYGVHSLVFTFDPTPAEVLNKKLPSPLCTLEQKIALLAEQGLDGVLFYPTTREFLQYSARDFFQKIVVDALGAVALVEGDNFYFGRDKEGSDDLLAQLCSEFNVRLEIPRPIETDGAHVSCTRIREMISKGEVWDAARLLGRYYSVRGVVEHGKGIGADQGFPTANLEGVTTLLPAQGVYAGEARLSDGRVFPAAINYGIKPTYNDFRVTIEPFLIGFSGDLYGQTLELSFIKRLRDIKHFSKEELQRQIPQDVEDVCRVYERRRIF